MNDLEQLRTTLGRHADDVVDHDAHARVGAVHQRVRVVRRRRRAAAVGTAALTAAAIGGLVLVPGPGNDPVPATPTVLGMTVPSSFDSLGYTYAFERTAAADDGRASVRLPAADVPQLVSWGTVGDDDTVEVTRYGSTTTYEAADFTDFVLVGPGDATSVRVVGVGAVGLAVYELTDDRPDGVTRDGLTYRQEVAGQQLVAAAFGEPGEAEVSLDAAAVSRGVSFRVDCAGAPADSSLHLDLGEEGGFVTGQCDETLPFDPGSAGSTAIRTRPGEDVSVRAWVSAGLDGDGPMLVSDDVVIAVSVYDDAPSGRVVAGSDVPEVVESGGHPWVFDSLAVSRPGQRSISAAGRDGQQVLAIGYARAGDRSTVALEHSETGETVRGEGTNLAGGEIGILSGPREQASARVVGPVPDGAELAIALYVRRE